MRFPYADAVPTLAALLAGRASRPAVEHARLLEAAAYHRLGGVLLAAARDGRIALDPRLRVALEHHEWQLVQRSAFHVAALPAVVAAIRRASEAEPIVLKGPDAASLYTSRSLRPFADLDLLVPRARLGNCVTEIEGLGYESLVELRPGFGETYGHDVRLLSRSERGDIGVELHWRIGDDMCTAPLDHARVASSALPLDNVPGVLRPGHTDRLFVFSAHLLSDRKRRLVWANDLRLAALDAPPTAWEAAFGLDNALAWLLHRALDRVEAAFGPVRPRPRPIGAPPPFGPIRAIEAWDAPAALHLGRLAQLGWRERLRYAGQVALPTRAGLEGTVGGDGAPGWRLALRHAARAARSILPQR